MKRRFFEHLAFWLAWLTISGLLAAPFVSQKSEPFWRQIAVGFLAEVSVFPFKIAAVYLAVYGFAPRFFDRKKESKRPLWLLIFGAVFAAAALVLAYRLTMNFWVSPTLYLRKPMAAKAFSQHLIEIGYTVLDFVSVIGIVFALHFFRQKRAAAERERRLKIEKTEAELRFLKAQTSPHFLFNTLNNIYHLARRKSDATAPAVLKLSDLLRFMLYDCSAPRVRLAQEIAAIEGFVELQKMRFSRPLEFIFEREIDDENRLIAPLILLPLVENAFKHGAAETREQPRIWLKIEAKGPVLTFFVENSTPLEPIFSNEKKGIGLQNLRRQLEIEGFDFELKMEAEPQLFRAFLTIKNMEK